MRRSVCSCALAVMLATSFWAQNKSVDLKATTAVSVATATRPSQPTKKSPTPEEKIGFELLESSLAGSRKLDAISQGEAAWQAARIYLRHSADKAKAAKLLTEGFSGVLSARDEQGKRLEHVRSTVEARLLKALIPLDVKQAEELLPQAEELARKDTSSALVNYYIGHGEDSKALELMRQTATEHEMNYRDAITLMSRLPPNMESLRRDIFVEAMTSFAEHEHDDSLLPGAHDFPNMILRFAQQLPPTLLTQAVEEVLSQGKKADAKMASEKGHLQAHISTNSGEATWTSYYDYELFALLPVLSETDPVAAEARVKDSPTASALLSKYKNGLSDLAPSMVDPSKLDPSNATSNSVTSIGVSMGDGAMQIEAPDPDQRAQIDISNQIGEHPETALTRIPQLKSGTARATTYVEVAQSQWQKHPATAHEALRKALDEASHCDPSEAGAVYTDVFSIYAQMGEEDGAKKALEKGATAAAKLYERDTNAELPNIAPVIFWPSSALWIRMVRAGAKISPHWAMELLKSAPGEDIASLGQMIIAAKLLDVNYLAPSVIELHPSSGQFHDGEEESEVMQRHSNNQSN